MHAHPTIAPPHRSFPSPWSGPPFRVTLSAAMANTVAGHCHRLHALILCRSHLRRVHARTLAGPEKACAARPRPERRERRGVPSPAPLPGGR